MGLDLSQYQGFWQRKENLSQGEIVLDFIDDEVRTGKLKLFSYIKLPD